MRSVLCTRRRKASRDVTSWPPVEYVDVISYLQGVHAISVGLQERAAEEVYISGRVPIFPGWIDQTDLTQEV